MSDENDQKEEVTLEQLQSDLDSAINSWKRTAADFENFKRQKEREGKELVDFAREGTVVKLLPTLDTLAQALKYMPSETRLLDGSSEPENFDPKNPDFSKQYHNWKIGMNVILVHLEKTLSELGVNKIETVGKKFDPNFHEAVKEVEGEEDGIIIDELQSGFELNGKVIRPSQVVVSKQMTSDK